MLCEEAVSSVSRDSCSVSMVCRCSLSGVRQARNPNIIENRMKPLVWKSHELDDLDCILGGSLEHGQKRIQQSQAGAENLGG